MIILLLMKIFVALHVTLVMSLLVVTLGSVKMMAAGVAMLIRYVKEVCNYVLLTRYGTIVFSVNIFKLAKHIRVCMYVCMYVYIIMCVIIL